MMFILVEVLEDYDQSKTYLVAVNRSLVESVWIDHQKFTRFRLGKELYVTKEYMTSLVNRLEKGQYL